ncbi:hypothetical protein D9M69_675870 [compost metagenome]
MIGENPRDPVAERVACHTQYFRLPRRTIGFDRSSNIGGKIDQCDAFGRSKTRADAAWLRPQNAESSRSNDWRNFIEISGASRKRGEQDNTWARAFDQKFDLTFMRWDQLAFEFRHFFILF